MNLKTNKLALALLTMWLAWLPSLSAQVQQAWVARYNGTGNNADEAQAIAVDSVGNVYVTGHSFGIGFDYATVKYATNGNRLWVARYNGPANGADYARALKLDSAGNVYVTGYSRGSGTGDDYATVKYNTSGTQLWVTRYNGPGSSNDVASALAVDNAGNVYVTGSSRDSTSGDDYATVKYDTNGNELWVARYNGPGNSNDVATALAVDSAGNVYVTGTSPDSTGGNDYATVKYGPDGNAIWVARYNGLGNGPDEARALAVDSAGNVYVTGSSYGSSNNLDYATVKYGADGNPLWVAFYNGPDRNTNDVASALAVDSAGNVYVTGSSGTAIVNSSSHYATIKYDANGTQLWAARYVGGGLNFNHARALTVDGEGNVYVTGDSKHIINFTDFSTVKYDAAGNQLWFVRYDDSGGDEFGTAMALDSAGNIYVTGYGRFFGDISAGDYATVKYKQNARPTVSISGPTNNAVFVLPSNILIMAQAADSDGSVTNVAFFAGTNPLGRVANSPYRITWSNPPPGNFVFTAVATDNVGASTTSAPVNITVSAINQAPVLAEVGDQMASVGRLLRVTNSAFDLDLPPQQLTFSLANPPQGAFVNPTNGRFRWIPTRDYGSTTNVIQVRVTDNGVPPLSAAQNFVVIVAEHLEPEIGSAILLAGGSTNVAIGIFSSIAITNPLLAVHYPPDRLSDLLLRDFGVEVAGGELVAELPERSMISLTSLPGQFLRGDRYVARFQFTAVSNRPSAFVPLVLTDLQARRWEDGSVATSLFEGKGRVVVIGDEPLLEALLPTNGLVQLILYARPGTTNMVESRANFDLQGSWMPWQQVTMTNLLQALPPLPAANQTLFFRAVRQ